MKTAITLCVLFLFLSTQAQYIKDWANAPMNPIPVQYTLNHFNLLGPVQSQNESVGSLSFDYYFDNNGCVSESGGSSDIKNYTYDTQHLLIGTIDIYSTHTFTNNNLGLTVHDEWNHNGHKGQNIYEYNLKGLFSKKTEISYSQTIVRSYIYDNYNRIIRQESSDDGGIFQTVSYTYSKQGNILKVTEAIDNVNNDDEFLSHYFDARGNDMWSENDRELVYDSMGNNTKLIDKKTGAVISEFTLAYYPYTDCYSGDCKNGWGLVKTPNGNYEGFLVDGKREGFGLYTWADGSQYTGSWENDVMEGLGKYQSPTMIIFGEFKNNKLVGRGYKIANGKAVIGIYENDEIREVYPYEANGNTTGCVGGDCESKFGKIVMPNGDWFEGFFKSGKMYFGDYKKANGDSYQGMFSPFGKYTGFGRLVKADGSFYGGIFIENELDGKGYFKNPAGTAELIGQWEKGKLVKRL